MPQADGKKNKLKFDDWFYRLDDRVCIVRGSAGQAGLPFPTAHVAYRESNQRISTKAKLISRDFDLSPQECDMCRGGLAKVFCER